MQPAPKVCENFAMKNSLHLLMCSAALLSACKDKAAAPATNATAPTPAAIPSANGSTTVAVTPPVAPTKPVGKDPCSLLTLADINAYTGKTLTVKPGQTWGAGMMSNCDYLGELYGKADSKVAWINYYPAQGGSMTDPASLPMSVGQKFHEVKVPNGKAWASDSNASVAAAVGDTFASVVYIGANKGIDADGLAVKLAAAL